MAGKRKAIWFILRHAEVGYPCEFFEVHCGLWVPWMDQATEFLSQERAQAYVMEFDLVNDEMQGRVSVKQFVRADGYNPSGFMSE